MHEDNVKYITTLKEIRIINDPYRREIINALRLLDKPVTAKDIADYLGEPPSKINYHVRVLHKHDFIDFHHTENINGILAKYYVASSSYFTIRISGNDSQSKELAAIRDVVASSYDIARDKHITALAKSLEESNDDLKEAETCELEVENFIYSKDVYLTEKEAKELTGFIESAHKNKKAKDRKLYHLFASCYKTNKND